MALSMENSSIGVSREGMIKVKESIKIELIDESIKSVNTNVEQLINNIDIYWHGSSANAFKVKVNSEKAKVVTILKVLEAKMELDLGVMATNSAIADAEVATAIIGSTAAKAVGGQTNNSNVSTPRDVLNSIENFWDNHEQKSIDYRQSLSEAERIEVDKAWDEAHKESNFDKAVRVGGSTLTNAAISFTKGAAEFVEDVSDTGAIVLTGAASVGTGIYDGITYVGSQITGDEWHSVTAEMWEGTKAYVSKDAIKSVFNDLYEDTNVGIWSRRNSIMPDKVSKMAEKAGYISGMGTTAKGLSNLIMGPGAYRDATVLTMDPTRKAAKKAADLAGATIVGGVAGFGKGAEQAWDDGASTSEGLKYAAASGAWGAAKSNVTTSLTQMIPGSNPEDPFIDKTIKGGAKTAAKEGLKHVKAYADDEVTPYMQKIYKQPGDGLVGVESTNDISVFSERSKNINSNESPNNNIRVD